MCISPHQMSNARLEEEIQKMTEYLADPRKESNHWYYESRIKMLEKLLKERAESGEYVNH